MIRIALWQKMQKLFGELGVEFAIKRLRVRFPVGATLCTTVGKLTFLATVRRFIEILRSLVLVELEARPMVLLCSSHALLKTCLHLKESTDNSEQQAAYTVHLIKCAMFDRISKEDNVTGSVRLFSLYLLNKLTVDLELLHVSRS